MDDRPFLVCPECHAWADEPHAPTCRLAALPKAGAESADPSLSAELPAALRYALHEGGWRAADIVGLLRGCARYANGMPVPVCERCRRPEYEDGLIATEMIDDGGGDADDTPIVGAFLCPRCAAETRGRVA